MKPSDAEVARRYGIAKSTYSVKSPAMKAQIREFVEAGGHKDTEDALKFLMQQAYRLQVKKRQRVTVDVNLTSFEVIVGANVVDNGNLVAWEIVRAAAELEG